MSKYGQYCPVAKALEILGDRWTLLIVRDLLTGTRHFNDLERGLPGISRALLARRLRQLQQAGVIEKRLNGSGRKTTEYRLTQAGQELLDVVTSLMVWGEEWAFGEPTPEELNPVLLMWWMRNRVNVERLPEHRVVAQFDFHGAERVTFWLILATDDVTICLTDPGYEINVLVTADLAAFFKLWAGRISYQEALVNYKVSVEGIPSLIRAFPDWFGWRAAAPVGHNARLLN
ncbi:MAG: helix-turn-helix transcriptional regulator [Chloroflexi bacterium]|nr:helix-turn-helix transcriptional regulator [Chloroflexota bacterium]MCI0579772.1 helix-turn-helix transcriptional regulator [Chloroflexota bacterium]MCI0649144.1 helix-turn-helix transcriptional regulator [Chloroflexota bacterium]MCI0731250.1 helix-turn-helix transcriptional regulator [Chloroflexota bacterium]